MPPNTVTLAQMMRELSAEPGLTERLLAALGDQQQDRIGPALLAPALVDRLRVLVLGQDWAGLDRFPGWTMRSLSRAVEAAEALLADDSANPTRHLPQTGPYTADVATATLDESPSQPAFNVDEVVTHLDANVSRGDAGNPALTPLHAQSLRLAQLLNRLSLNGEAGYATFSVAISGNTAQTPEALVEALQATGHSVQVHDTRYFANFGHLHYHGQPVQMPFWVDTRIQVPGTGRTLLVPVSHAEYQWQVRGPMVNAAVAWYFGVDGGAEFRTMDTLDQAWVMGHYAHTYTGTQAVEVTRLAGRMLVAYLHLHQRHPELPFGGYYLLGVCQDSVAAIERSLTGRTTLYPNTADLQFFDDARDEDVNQLLRRVPRDASRQHAPPDRIFGSLPVALDQFDRLPDAQLAEDLRRVYAAWQADALEYAPSLGERVGWWLKLLATLVAGAGVLGILLWLHAKAR
ncbi:MAG: hypothetical protein KGK08_03430 [Acidobacteriota bacterium]|nr:hypothetical protein [Acidobacteriota bacterium]